MKMVIGILLSLVVLTSCSTAQQYTAKTKAYYKITDAQGVTKEINYESDKEQVGLTAEVDPDTGKMKVSVDRASTQIEVIAAVLQQNVAMMAEFRNALSMIREMMLKAAPVAATAGS